MMTEPVGDMAYVTGKRSDIVATGPIPGSTPTRVPTKTPMKQAKRCIGWSATWRPKRRFWAKSIADQNHPHGPTGSCTPSHTLKTTCDAPAVKAELPTAIHQRIGSTTRERKGRGRRGGQGGGGGGGAARAWRGGGGRAPRVSGPGRPAPRRTGRARRR